MVKVKRLVSIGIALGVLAFPTSSFASTGNSTNHQSQTYSSINQVFSSWFGNKGGDDLWDRGKWGEGYGGKGGKGGKDDNDHNGGDCPDSYDIWQKWYSS